MAPVVKGKKVPEGDHDRVDEQEGQEPDPEEGVELLVDHVERQDAESGELTDRATGAGRVEEAGGRDRQDAIGHFEAEAPKADPGELTVEEEVGELELEDHVDEVQSLAQVVLDCDEKY